MKNKPNHEGKSNQSPQNEQDRKYERENQDFQNPTGSKGGQAEQSKENLNEEENQYDLENTSDF